MSENKIEQDLEKNIVAYTLYRNIISPKPDIVSKTHKQCSFKPKFKFFSYQVHIPLLIKDILNLKLDTNNFGRNLCAYGVHFGSVMIYGICIPKGYDHKTKKVKYTLDDGTGEINIKYSTNTKNECRERISNLKMELEIETKRTKKDIQSANMIQSLCNILSKAETNVRIPETHHEAGTRLIVVGIPYKIYSDTWIHATEIDLDQDQSRRKELLYKKNLVKFYNEHSQNFNLDGERINRN